MKADRIALLALFMLAIQEFIFSFVRTWNRHCIRKQQNRPNSIAGQPIRLYHYPGIGIQNYAILVQTDLVTTMSDDIATWGERKTLHCLYNIDVVPDENEYLPIATEHWCQIFLQENELIADTNLLWNMAPSCTNR